MTPGARLQTAIEVLERWDRERIPLERSLANWARSNRYAGSRDRRAVRELVFAVIRRRGRLIDLARSETPRTLLITYLCTEENRSPDEIAGIFSGDRYQPAVFDNEERLLAERLQNCELPDIEPLPGWLSHDDFDQVQGIDFSHELRRMTERAPVDIRVNSLKSSTDKVQEKLSAQGLETITSGLVVTGLRLSPTADSSPDLTVSDLYRSGAIEIQDQSTQVAAALVDARPQMQVLDLCAGAGGKSLALAATMQNTGQIFATDIESGRLKQLKVRADRAGVRNLQSRVIQPRPGSGPDPDFPEHGASFDRILIDAPCSGSGVWRRAPDHRWRLTDADLQRYIAIQRELVHRAVPLLKPGGRLVYVTCSMLKSENTQQNKWVKDSFKDLESISVERVWQESTGLNQAALLTTIQPQSDGSLLLTPESANTDGCYVAVFARR